MSCQHRPAVGQTAPDLVAAFCRERPCAPGKPPSAFRVDGLVVESFDVGPDRPPMRDLLHGMIIECPDVVDYAVKFFREDEPVGEGWAWWARRMLRRYATAARCEHRMASEVMYTDPAKGACAKCGWHFYVGDSTFLSYSVHDDVVGLAWGDGYKFTDAVEAGAWAHAVARRGGPAVVVVDREDHVLQHVTLLP